MFSDMNCITGTTMLNTTFHKFSRSEIAGIETGEGRTFIVTTAALRELPVGSLVMMGNIDESIRKGGRESSKYLFGSRVFSRRCNVIMRQ